jgi:hypothetical protein
VRKFNKRRGIHQDVDVGGLELQKDDKGEVAFTFRTTLSDILGNDDTYSEIDVEAQGLRNLLKSCIGSDYPGQNLDGDTVNLVTPFAPLVCLLLPHDTQKAENGESAHFLLAISLIGIN